MKYVKYLIGLLGILIVAFLLLGLFKSEVSYDCEIIADKPFSETWAVTQDVEKMSEWLPGYLKSEHVSGVPGTVGAVSVVHFMENGQETKIEETITEIVPNESISMTFKSDFMDMNYKMKMTPENGSTRINTSTTARGNGMFSKSIMALMGATIKGQEEANLINLKKAIEENEKQYSSQ